MLLRTTIALALASSVRWQTAFAAADYKLEVVAYSPDYPPDPMGTARAFGSPQINELGQVSFLASWGLNGPQIVLYLGRPGAVNGVARYRDPAPAFGGEFLQFSEAHLNSRGEILFRGTMGFVNPPPKPLPHLDVIWRDTYGVALQTNPVATDLSDLPPANVTGAPYTGTGRLQYKSNALMAPLFLADNGVGYHGGALEAAEGGVLVPVASKCLILSDNLTRRLIWYDGAPAPGLTGDYLFLADPISGVVGIPLTFAKKNGAYVARTTVRPLGSSNLADNKLVFYQYADDQLTPFYVAGDPLPGGLPTPMELFGDDNVTEPYTLRYSGAQIADETGNTVIEVEAFSFDGTKSRLIGVWKKMPQGLVEVLRYDRDYPVNSGIVRFSGAGTYKLGIDKKYSAMGNGKLAFWMHYTGLGQTFPIPALFRERKEEDGGGFERVLTDGVTAPGTNYVCTGLDGIRHQALLMNANREVVFLGGVSGGGALDNSPALWMVDRLGVLRHIVHNGQTITIGGVARTVFDFVLPNVAPAGSPHPYTPDAARFLNDDGAIVFSVRFTDNTRAIIRAVPDGYIDPPLPGRDFWFNNAKDDNNWHTTGGNPPTNWEDLDGTPRSNAPGDVDINTAAVFIPEEFSVVLDQRPAPIGTLQLDGSLTLREALTLNYNSPLANLRVEGTRGALNINGAIANGPNTDWINGTMTLSGPILPGIFRNTGEFRASAGSIEKLDDNVAFQNDGRFILETGHTFTVNVPFRSAGTPSLNDPPRIVVESGSILQLFGGGSFGNKHKIAIPSGTTVELAGAFTVEGELDFVGESQSSQGTLHLGTTDKELDLELGSTGSVEFDLSGNTTVFERGRIRGGDGVGQVLGLFQWKGGQISVGGNSIAKEFQILGTMEVLPGPLPRRLGGRLTVFPFLGGATDSRTVRQRASLEILGEVENEGDWLLDAPSNLTGSGDFINADDGLFATTFSETGTCFVDVRFQNVRGGTVQVGSSSGSTSAVLHFRWPVANLRDGRLRDGWWIVHPGSSLIFPSDVEALAGRAFMHLNGGTIPSLQLREVAARLDLEDVQYKTPQHLTVAGGINPGFLRVTGSSTLTIDGDLTNRGRITCVKGAQIIIEGSLSNHSSASLHNDGRIEVRGGVDATLPGRFTGSGTYVLPGTAVMSLNGSIEPGTSPGILTIEGAAAFASTTNIQAELSGTSADLYDVVAVTQNLTLGGTLVVRLLDNFMPATGQTFPVVQAGAISGAFVNVASDQRLSVSDGSGSFVVHYGAGSPFNPAHVVLANWQPAAAGSPSIATQPATQSVDAGNVLMLSVAASGAGTLQYQWRYNGANIAGATSASYAVPSAQGFHAGSYSVVVTNATGTVYSDVASISVEGTPDSAARLLNLSTRAQALTGDDVLIPGFVIAGSGTKRLLIRAVGPTLGQKPFELAGTLPDPRMRLLKRNPATTQFEEIAANDNWGTNANAAAITQTAAEVFAFAFKDDHEAALLMDLGPGEYTAIAGGVNNATGLAIVELYDADSGTPAARLINISNRGFCGVGDQVMIPGFVVSSEGPKTFLVRVVGPTLGSFNVPGTMADPKLEVFPSGVSTPILANDNWGDNPDAAYTVQIAQQVQAFSLTNGSKDAAFVVTLPPGGYTVVGSSATTGGTGVVLVEVYVVP
jgi:hypothetical protein